MRLSPLRWVAAAILLFVATALAAQEFRIDDWRAYALLGSPGLEAGTDYAAFTGHHGIQSDWLPDEKLVAAYVEKDASLLSHFQLRVINLGAPLPGLLGTPISKQIDDVVLASLTRPHYDLASRANNHAFDLGAEGMRYYEQKLDAAGIRIVGQRGFPVFHWRVGAHRIDIAALADVLDKPDPDGWILLMSDANLEAAKREMQGADYRIVLAHLGSASRYPSPHEREQVMRLQKAGFDLVVATGAHFVKGVLVEEGRPVAYGLGDHFLSVVYDPKTGTEPVGMHLVSGFRDARLVPALRRSLPQRPAAGHSGSSGRSRVRRVRQDAEGALDGGHFEVLLGRKHVRNDGARSPRHDLDGRAPAASPAFRVRRPAAAAPAARVGCGGGHLRRGDRRDAVSPAVRPPASELRNRTRIEPVAMKPFGTFSEEWTTMKTGIQVPFFRPDLTEAEIDEVVAALVRAG
jgi:hypothetical protein